MTTRDEQPQAVPAAWHRRVRNLATTSALAGVVAIVLALVVPPFVPDGPSFQRYGDMQLKASSQRNIDWDTADRACKDHGFYQIEDKLDTATYNTFPIGTYHWVITCRFESSPQD